MQPMEASTAERNAEIRRLRALPGGERPSLAALALKHGISRERVRQIEVCENHPDPGDLHYPNGILLRRESAGMYECLKVGGRGKAPRRLGSVTGRRGHWTFSAPGQVLTAGSLPAIAQHVAEGLGIRSAA